MAGESAHDEEVTRLEPEVFSDLDAPTADVQINVVEARLFGKVWAPQTLGEYAALIQAPTLAQRELSGWRGQSSITWPLHSGAVRRLQDQPRAALLDTAPVTEDVVRTYEDVSSSRPGSQVTATGQMADG